MNFQDLQNLSEAYLEVVEGRVSWHDPKNPNPSGYTPKEKSEAKRKQLRVDDPDTQSFEKGGPGENEYARHANLSSTQEKMSKRGQQPKGKPHQFKKNPFWKKTQGQVKRTILGTDVPKDKKSSYPSSVATAKEEVDIYDIILSHLLDEGYAETPEAAEAIMANMDEEWAQSIVEEILDEAEGSYGQTPRARAAMGRLAVSRMNKPASEYSERGEKSRKVKAAEKHTRRQDRLASGNNRYGSRGPMDQARRNWSRGADDYGHTGYDGEGYGGSVTKNPKKLRKQKAMGEIKESYDLFDYILEHLVAEGFADTNKAAIVIMANMSEEWRESIIC
jgi:hypothetical protein